MQPNEIAVLSERVIVLTETWLTRDERIAPIVIIGESDNSEDSKLRREDHERRDIARLDLIESVQKIAAAIAHIHDDLSPLLTLLDCAQRDDQLGGMSARLGAKLLLQQVAIRIRTKPAGSDPIGVAELNLVRADCTRTLVQLLATIEDGRLGRELDVVRPLFWQIESALRRLGYDRVPIRYHVEERDGNFTATFELSYPWGGSHSVLLSQSRLGGSPGDQVREHFDTQENLISPENREEIQRVLRAWQRELSSHLQPVPAPVAPPAAHDPPVVKRMWTQAAVDDAIRRYATSIERRLREVQRAIEEGTPGAVKDARKMFGRNALVKKLECSAGLVSDSTVWRAIANRLKLRGDTPGISRSDRVGIERASDEQSHTDWKQGEAEQRHDDASDQTRRRQRPGA